MKSRLNITRVRELYANKHEPENMHALAVIYWRMLLYLLLTTTLCAMLYGAWQVSGLFFDTAKRPTLEGNAPIPAVSRTQIEEVLHGLGERSAKFNALMRTPGQFPDPSR